MTSKIFLEQFNNKTTVQGRELLIEFFMTFSRFEYGLKKSITFANGDANKVDANWDGFVASIKDQFKKEKTEELSEAVNFILSSPPMIQVLADGLLNWRPREFADKTPDIVKLCLHIRDIRNNLFHGGKFTDNYQPETSRNYKLLHSALIIMNEWLLLDEGIQEHFLGGIGE